MDLASGYVFAADSDGENVEEVLEDELETGWAFSSPVVVSRGGEDEDGAALFGAPPPPAAPSAPQPPPPAAPPTASAPRRGILDLFSHRPPPARGAFGVGGGGLGMPLPPPPPAQAPMMAGMPPPPPHPKMAYRARAAPQTTQRRFQQKVDTNVVCVKLGTLADGVAVHSGDAVLCKSCGAVFNDKSRLVPAMAGCEAPSVWDCEFCSHANEVDLAPEERPASDSVDFVLKPSEAVAASLDDNNIVFCIDTSGSMCVTTEVPGHIALRNPALRRMHESLREHMDGSLQRLPGQRGNVSYVSRLQSVQGAVDAQIQAMMKNHPRRHLGLVTFNNEVQIIGDGTAEKVVVAGDRLASRETLVDVAAQANSLQKPVGETSRALSTQVFGLEEGGQTALGPALLVSVAMAATRPGGRVVLCTDGKANVGLGSLDVDGIEADAAAGLFYDEVAQFAKEKGVTVDVVSITGTECRLEHLGRVADVTGGSVERVDPAHLADNFQSMLEKPVVATKVSVKMMLHKGLAFRDEEAAATSSVTRDVGAANADTEILFEFSVRPEFLKTLAAATAAAAPMDTTPEAGGAATGGAAAPMDTMPEAEAEADEEGKGKGKGKREATSPVAAAAAAAPTPKELPFQVQIRFTKPDGMECLRVITKTKPVTRDRTLCEKTVDVALCSAHVAQKSARLAQEGKYEEARVNGFAWRNMLGKVATSSHASVQQQAQYQNFQSNLSELDDAVHSAQRMERVTPRAPASASISARDYRSANRSDEQSRAMFKNKKATSRDFK